jgi:hypothetical protein
MPRPFNLGLVTQGFHDGIVGELQRAGMFVAMPQAATPDYPIVIRVQAVKADPGSRLMRYLFTWFAGAAQFEAEGAIGDASAPFAQLHAAGTRRAGIGGGDSDNLLADAARMAGQRIGKQIVDILTVR